MRLLLAAVILLALGASAQGAEIHVRVAVPKNVADAARRRAAGDEKAPAPVLMLDGLEFHDSEGLKITVLADDPAPNAVEAHPVVAVTGTVGSHTVAPTPTKKMSMPVPLNDRVLKLLAEKSSVMFTLRVEKPEGREALKFARATLSVGSEKPIHP